MAGIPLDPPIPVLFKSTKSPLSYAGSSGQTIQNLRQSRLFIPNFLIFNKHIPHISGLIL
jgi:hypothetical protein